MMEAETGQASFMLALICFLVFKATLDFGLFWWGRWIVKRNDESLLWRMVQWSPVVAFTFAALGAGYGSWQLSNVFNAILGASVEYRAEMLARGISETLNQIAFFNVPALLIELACFVACIVGTVQSRGKSPAKIAE